nr:hypothetical protein GCM10020093_016880 [Planobispora longispora]
MVNFVDESVPLAGAVLFGAAALTIMASVDPAVTLVLVIPAIAIGVLSRLLNRTIRRLHRRSRTLGAAVTGHLGEIFGAVLAIKTAGAEEAALERLRRTTACAARRRSRTGSRPTCWAPRPARPSRSASAWCCCWPPRPCTGATSPWATWRCSPPMSAG